MQTKKRVIIVGGGFGGINAAKTLQKCKDLEITILDQRNHHLFQPLLYQVAMAGLSPAEIACPIRSLFRRKKNVSVFLAKVNELDLKNRSVKTAAGNFTFDYCILACGANSSYFGNTEWEQFAPGLKTIEQATEIRRRVLMAFERAESSGDRETQRYFLTFVVVGGGPTGVELAGAIGEISKYTLDKDFRNIDPGRTRIILIEAGERILQSFDPSLSRKTCRALEKLGVQVWTSSKVSEISKDGVVVGDEFLRAKTVLWAAGVGPSDLSSSIDCPKDRQGRLKVEPDLSLPGHSNVFCIGDQAHTLDRDQKPLPGLAPVAIQQGRYVGKLIIGDLKDKERQPFQYWDKGQLATIGRKSAVMQVGRLKSFGFFAWLVWLFVHIFYLIGFRNRMAVFWQWAWHYISYARGARLIIHKSWRMFDKKT